MSVFRSSKGSSADSFGIESSSDQDVSSGDRSRNFAGKGSVPFPDVVVKLLSTSCCGLISHWFCNSIRPSNAVNMFEEKDVALCKAFVNLSADQVA
jgi:hypothetical protein